MILDSALPLIVLSISVAVVCGVAMCLRLAAWRDVVLRYRLLVATLPLLLLLAPIQLMSMYAAPDAWRGGWRTPVGLRPVESARVDPLQIESVPGDASAHDLIASTPVVQEGPLVLDASSTSQVQRLLWIYALGVCGMALHYGWRLARTRSLLSAAHRVTNADQLVAWSSLVAQYPRLSAVRLLESDDINVPACWGWGRPAVLIPRDTYEPDMLDLALRHEIEHLRRRDPLVVAGEMLLATLYWFHPVMWMYTRALRRDREFSCDAIVVRQTGRPRSYAMALIAYCARTASLRNLCPSFGEPAPEVRVQRRLQMLAHAQTTFRPRRQWMTAILGCLTIPTLLGAHVAMSVAVGPPGPLGAEFGLGERGVTKMEVHAPVEGRSDSEMLFHISNMLQINRPLQHEFEPGRVMVNQETVLSCADGRRLDDMRLVATEFNMNLPEGSKTRIEFVGDRVIVEPAPDQTTFIVNGGVIHFIDPDGVIRVQARPSQDGRLRATATRGHEVEFRIRAETNDGEPCPVEMRYDTRTGKPVDEDLPPHGAVRFKMLDDAEGTVNRMKMQWAYDLHELQKGARVQESSGKD